MLASHDNRHARGDANMSFNLPFLIVWNFNLPSHTVQFNDRNTSFGQVISVYHSTLSRTTTISQDIFNLPNRTFNLPHHELSVYRIKFNLPNRKLSIYRNRELSIYRTMNFQFTAYLKNNCKLYLYNIPYVFFKCPDFAFSGSCCFPIFVFRFFYTFLFF